MIPRHRDSNQSFEYVICLPFHTLGIHSPQGWRESGFNCWGVKGSTCYSCFMWMYLECACGHACPSSLWLYWLPGFSFALGSYKNKLTVWSLRVVRGDWKVQGTWVGDSLTISFFVLFSFFTSVLHLLWVHPLPGLGFKVSPSVPRSLFSFIFSPPCSFLLYLLSLALVHADPNVAGVGSCVINKYPSL